MLQPPHPVADATRRGGRGTGGRSPAAAVAGKTSTPHHRPPAVSTPALAVPYAHPPSVQGHCVRPRAAFGRARTSGAHAGYHRPAACTWALNRLTPRAHALSLDRPCSSGALWRALSLTPPHLTAAASSQSPPRRGATPHHRTWLTGVRSVHVQCVHSFAWRPRT